MHTNATNAIIILQNATLTASKSAVTTPPRTARARAYLLASSISAFCLDNVSAFARVAAVKVTVSFSARLTSVVSNSPPRTSTLARPPAEPTEYDPSITRSGPRVHWVHHCRQRKRAIVSAAWRARCLAKTAAMRTHAFRFLEIRASDPWNSATLTASSSARAPSRRDFTCTKQHNHEKKQEQNAKVNLT